MINQNQALAQLRDIHLPPAIGVWPLAIGWRILLVFTFLTCCSALYFAYCRRYRPSYKRLALRLLADYEKNYHHHKNAQQFALQISDLLRRVALVYYPRAEVAKLHGQAWINFLNCTGKPDAFSDLNPSLTQITYQDLAYEFDCKPLYNSARTWIKKRSKPCLN